MYFYIGYFTYFVHSRRIPVAPKWLRILNLEQQFKTAPRCCGQLRLWLDTLIIGRRSGGVELRCDGVTKVSIYKVCKSTSYPPCCARGTASKPGCKYLGKVGTL